MIFIIFGEELKVMKLLIMQCSPASCNNRCPDVLEGRKGVCRQPVCPDGTRAAMLLCPVTQIGPKRDIDVNQMSQVSTPASYMGGPVFKSGLETGYPERFLFVVVFSSSRQTYG
jgi:hypothetical protein